ncbi:translation initiation factor eIF3 core subunit b [Aspergillus mulundensis]|uniref:Eukaryotic translation initiation factor 3 subunit B n=1 Tax=Aspergillus mulundensis TaxID=1810919 RepID=A0A3D8R9T8_9EURO|nr:Eukaryotic translation initiation factor 3 subunit B [Aspergillus mulundensis]RDW70720.1 Eukaryotic translation initiation factor 3 subunit B [Aspergillus mulundensis]
MAPSFENLSEQDLHEEEEEEIDFSDLKAQYEVKLEEGLDTFVVIDGLPVVPEDNRQKLVKFLLRKLNAVGHTSEDAVFMPVNEKNMTEGFAFVEYETPEQAVAAVKQLHGTPLDKKHTLLVNKLMDIERYGREGRIDEEYKPPTIEPFAEKEHLRSWIGDANARDQFALYRGDKVGVFWNNKSNPPENVVDRAHWTQLFVQWSPKGTYLASVHPQGVQLWGGPTFSKQKQFPHPFVSLIEFSPGESYLTTWSARPIQVEEGHPVLTYEEDGKNIIVWDIVTGKPLRSFVSHDLAGPESDAQPKKKVQWPAFKWSADEKYVARMLQGQSISIYELPRMNLLGKTSVKIDGVMDFEWSPATVNRDGVKQYEQLLCFWTPEIGSNPARVALMSVPSKEIVRTRNLFNVSDVKLHWQSQGNFVCVKVDRHSKSKKSMATNLEIFRVREKGVPVEVVDSLKDTVINFSWEPNGARFVLITTGDASGGGAAPKTAVSFFAPEKKGVQAGNFKLVRTVEKKNSNAIYWSPKGRFVVVATVHSQSSFDLDFWDMDFEGEKNENEKDLAANLQLMKTVDHYGVTDIEWDPTGRYVVSGASAWTHQMENGFNLHTFAGETLAENPTDKFKQFLWRPRPPTLLSKEEQKQVRKNLREYSKEFEEEDKYAVDIANTAVVEKRKRVLNEWVAWLRREKELLAEEKEAYGLSEEVDSPKLAKDAPSDTEDKGETVVEEIVEEIVEESEEIIG